MVPVGKLGVPLKAGDAKGAFKSKAVCVAVEIGLFTSDVLSTFPNPTSPLTIPVGVVIDGLVNVLLVKVSVPANVAKVPVAPGKVIVVPVPAAAGATTVAVPELDPGKSIPAEANVCFPVNVCAASVRAIVALAAGKVIVVPSVPASVKLLLAVNVLPSAIVNVDELAGAVIVTLFTLVAVATPIVGVTNVGLVSITNLLPVPVWDATEVTFPILVIGPVKFAFVAFAVLIAPVTNSVVAT